jgi:hypothetical protein
MRALCPDCGFHHEVIRVLEDPDSESHREVYETAPFDECTRRWMSDTDVLDAHARFGTEAIIEDDEIV